MGDLAGKAVSVYQGGRTGNVAALSAVEYLDKKKREKQADAR